MLQKYRVIYEKRVAKDMDRIPHYEVVKIIEKIHALAHGEVGLDIKKLKGYIDNLYRLRVGDYRIVYEKRGDELIILILKVGHRKDIYL
ncbi:type II toxin-antitoxin system RelE/ParE family toxin [Candidatus Gracilibacteria bacterium]|nr:type II toxin-antitoxin system RelE/ParE family toxin [Candidatus Gracilibacteria bacterium]